MDRASIEAKAAAFSIGTWLLVWTGIGAAGRLAWGDWYGFGAGFLIAPLVSIPLMWWLFARPTAREKRLVRASWAEHTLRIFDPIDQRHESVDFSKPHRAVLILSKPDRQFLLRLEQNRGSEDWTRIDIIGHTPMALPMKASGEAHSLRGFFRMARRDGLRFTPYRLKDEGQRDAAAALIAFVETFKDQRNNEVRVKRGDETLRIENGAFALRRGTEEISFADMDRLRLSARVGTAQTVTGKKQEATRSVEIQLALIPPSGEADALVFSMIAHPDSKFGLPQAWSIPEEAMARKFTLYDDSVNSFIVTSALKNHVKQIDPNSPVLDILRN